jgi:hypothetical protein
MRAIWPPYKTKLILREMGKGGLRGHINANCIDCVYEQTEQGSWIKQVDECGVTDCPLHPVRPKHKPRRKEATNG